jgi:hypothetical protein
MSDTPLISETEARRRIAVAQREAFCDGVRVMFMDPIVPNAYEAKKARERITALAESRYPLPTVTKPRERTDAGGVRWRVEDGVLQFRMLSGTWGSADLNAWPLDAERIALWHDLFTTPTEAVPVEEG